jgi:hypothetical protein
VTLSSPALLIEPIRAAVQTPPAHTARSFALKAFVNVGDWFKLVTRPLEAIGSAGVDTVFPRQTQSAFRSQRGLSKVYDRDRYDTGIGNSRVQILQGGGFSSILMQANPSVTGKKREADLIVIDGFKAPIIGANSADGVSDFSHGQMVSFAGQIGLGGARANTEVSHKNVELFGLTTDIKTKQSTYIGGEISQEAVVRALNEVIRDRWQGRLSNRVGIVLSIELSDMQQNDPVSQRLIGAINRLTRAEPLFNGKTAPAVRIYMAGGNNAVSWPLRYFANNPNVIGVQPSTGVIGQAETKALSRNVLGGVNNPAAKAIANGAINITPIKQSRRITGIGAEPELVGYDLNGDGIADLRPEHVQRFQAQITQVQGALRGKIVKDIEVDPKEFQRWVSMIQSRLDARISASGSQREFLTQLKNLRGYEELIRQGLIDPRVLTTQELSQLKGRVVNLNQYMQINIPAGASNQNIATATYVSAYHALAQFSDGLGSSEMNAVPVGVIPFIADGAGRLQVMKNDAVVKTEASSSFATPNFAGQDLARWIKQTPVASFAVTKASVTSARSDAIKKPLVIQLSHLTSSIGAFTPLTLKQPIALKVLTPLSLK